MSFLELVRVHLVNDIYIEFVNNFMSEVYYALYGGPSPRLFPECNNLLQMIPDSSVGYWFLYENHNGIRIYGFEISPH